MMPGDLPERFGLADAAGRSVKAYSGGMRSRLDLAASLVQRPAVLFLDEPATGLDPRRRSEVWAMIRALVAEGTTVLLTTQYLDEADRRVRVIPCWHIGRGKIVTRVTWGLPEVRASAVGLDAACPPQHLIMKL
jgi:ABC-type multidrug transport system ATPase subunit